MLKFNVWRRYHNANAWTMTAHEVRARTDKEAQSKVTRRFAKAEFSSLSLVAVRDGLSPRDLKETLDEYRKDTNDI